MTDLYKAFGGEKQSGAGRFNGGYVMDKFTTTQWVTMQREGRQYPF